MLDPKLCYPKQFHPKRLCPKPFYPKLIGTVAAMAVCLSAHPRFDPKGNDLDEMDLQDSLARIRLAKQENLRLERRRDFLEAMRLEQPETECVALLARTRKCLMDVGAFNRSTERLDPPADSGAASAGATAPAWMNPRVIDSLRADWLGRMLQRDFVQDRLEQSERKDSLKAAVDKAEAQRIARTRAAAGDSTLRKLYGRYRQSHFDAREERRFQVVGSTDSLYADSLARACRVRAVCDSLPWSSLMEAEIPAPFPQACLPKEIGALSGPVKTAFGFFLFRLQSRRTAPVVPYEQAVPQLAALRTLPRGTEPRVEAELSAYYLRNRDNFLAPDTVSLRAWLLPSFKRKAGAFAADIERKIRLREPVADTLNLVSLPLPLDSLPQDIRLKLSAGNRLRPNRLVGPLPSLWGCWYFQVSEIRRGTERLPFEQVRGEILRILYPGQTTDPWETARAIAEGKLDDIKSRIASEYFSKDGGNGAWQDGFTAWLRSEVALKYVGL